MDVYLGVNLRIWVPKARLYGMMLGRTFPASDAPSLSEAISPEEVTV